MQVGLSFVGLISAGVDGLRILQLIDLVCRAVVLSCDAPNFTAPGMSEEASTFVTSTCKLYLKIKLA